MKSDPEVVLGCWPAAIAGQALAALNVFATVPEWGALARGARRRQSQSLRCDQCAAGPAPRRGQAEPDRARAQRRSRRRNGRRTRNRLAAARDAAGGQSEDRSRASRAISRPRAYVHDAREADAARPRRWRRAPARQSAHPDRSAQHRCAWPPRWPRALARARPGNAAFYQDAAQGFRRRAGVAAIARLGEAGRRRSSGAPIVVQHKAFTYLIAWLGMKEIAALEPKPGVEPDGAR